MKKGSEISSSSWVVENGSVCFFAKLESIPDVGDLSECGPVEPIKEQIRKKMFTVGDCGLSRSQKSSNWTMKSNKWKKKRNR